ncbi:hypothetical protein [Neptunomonas concharum]|nr:hypothetical protein [Neptunomonas concharum]
MMILFTLILVAAIAFFGRTLINQHHQEKMQPLRIRTQDKPQRRRGR